MAFFERVRILFFTAFILLLAQGKATAQDSYYVESVHNFYGGLIAGANFTQVDGDYIAGYDRVGLNVGGIVYVQFKTHLAASMEILYSQKGSRSTAPVQLPSGITLVKYGMKLNYAEVPVMLNYFDKRKTNFGAGFSFSELATSSEYITTSPAQNFDLDKYPYKKTDINFITGCNLHVWKGFFLNVRFQYSLFSIRDYIPQATGKTTQYNNLWVVRMMYLFI